MRKALTVLVVLLAFMSGSAFAVLPEDYTGVVEVSTVQAQPGESVSVPIWLTSNNADISAISLPLTYESSHLVLDSVSLNNSIWGSNFQGLYAIDNSTNSVRITVLPNETITPLPTVTFEDGQVAEMYFTLAGDAQPEMISIDSVYKDSVLFGDVHIITRLDVSDNTGSLVYLPDYVPGAIEVLVPTANEDGPTGLSVPSEFNLSQNYPNPFNPTTMIEFALPVAGNARLQVFNILGQEVATLVDRRFQAGYHEVEFDASTHPSGIYFYRLTTEEGTATRKMVLVK